MSAKWREWRRLGAPRLLVQWLRSGVPLRWRGPAPRRSEESGEKQDKEVTREIRGLVKDGAFIRGEAKVVAPTFLIPKQDGTKRLIHDLRCVNRHLEPPHFTLRGAKEAGDVTRGSNWLAALDLRHGYQQVAMDPRAREYLGARMGDETVLSTVLPFGLSLSPYVFTRLTNWLAREVRRRFGLQVAVYIDDFLLGAQTREELEEGIRRTKSLFERLGVIVSAKKEVEPTQRAEFIGFVWDAEAKTVGVPTERRAEYRRAVKNLLRCPQTRATWRRVIGKLGFLREAVGPTMRHIRSLLHAAARRSGPKLLEATGEAREDLEWWRRMLGHKLELSLEVKPITGSITTDAADGGLGFLVSTEGAGSGKTGVQAERSMEPACPEAHINRKEIEAVLRALQEHREDLRGRRVVWYSDSTTALAAVRRQGTQRLAPGTWEVTKQVLDLAEQEQIGLLPRHVPGRLNGAADALSRPGEERTEWERAFEKIAKHWGPLQEDPCGATREATSLLESLEWASKRALLCPKPQQVQEVVNLLTLCAETQAPSGHPSLWPQMAVLVTPLWRGSTWWPTLEKLRVGYLPLGRLESGGLKNWAQRNGHAPEWTASLVALRTPSGPRGRERCTSGCSLASSAGRTGRAWPQREEREGRREA